MPTVKGRTSVMLLILQRYYFESESQHSATGRTTVTGCCLSYKDTILKANHNSTPLIPFMIVMLLILQRYYFESESQRSPANRAWQADVAYPTKILFWKRITTAATYISILAAMLLILQRYYFESESQLDGVDSYKDAGCCLSYKDTILKANHNLATLMAAPKPDVAYPTKILFWKRITTQQWVLRLWQGCCLSYKDTILKANHNPNGCCNGLGEDVAYPTKILFWKRITTIINTLISLLWCCLSYKDTILKANHNFSYLFPFLLMMLLILQRYYFESESQPKKQYIRIEFDVAYPTKILFWKRITTLKR